MKTSISLDDTILSKLEDYRATKRPIPSLSKAIIDLINLGLEPKTTELPKTIDIPKEAIKLEDLTIHMRDPAEGRGGSSQLNLPYHTILDHGLKNLDKIDAWISRKV